jgi:hypothetical protein
MPYQGRFYFAGEGTFLLCRDRETWRARQKRRNNAERPVRPRGRPARRAWKDAGAPSVFSAPSLRAPRCVSLSRDDPSQAGPQTL